MYQFHQEQHAQAIQAVQRQQRQQLRADSWVMKTPEQEGFVKLPHEQILHKSPLRTSLEINSPNPFPGAQPYAVKSDGGIVYLTNQRVRYNHIYETQYLTSMADSLPSYSSHTCTRIVLFAYIQPTRYICSRSLLWRKLLDSIMQASCRRWNTFTASTGRVEVNVPGGRGLRFPHKV